MLRGPRSGGSLPAGSVQQKKFLKLRQYPFAVICKIPLAIRANSLPKGPFWGPQEAIDIRTLDSLSRYEEWQYEHNDTVYLIWFGDPAREKSDWRMIGNTSYPKGAVF